MDIEHVRNRLFESEIDRFLSEFQEMGIRMPDASGEPPPRSRVREGATVQEEGEERLYVLGRLRALARQW